MGKQINARIQHKIDTYENWNKAENFIPLEGELIIYTTNESGIAETKIKIGDGKTLVKDLDFAAGDSASGEAGTNVIQSDWAQADNTQLDYIKNKPGDEIKEEEITNFVENYQLEEGQEVVPSMFTFGTIIVETAPQIGEKVRMFVKTSDNENIFIGEETLYHDAVLQEVMGGVNDDPWGCCTINSTVKNAAEAIQTGNLPIADETIPYAFAIVIVPDGRGGGYITIASTENLAGLNVTLQKIKTNLTTIKLANNALNIDLEPTENSDNLITSGTIYNYFNNLPKIQLITWEDDD